MSAIYVMARAEAGQAKRARRRIPPNFFSIPLGLAGLANAWHAAVPVLGFFAAALPERADGNR